MALSKLKNELIQSIKGKLSTQEFEDARQEIETDIEDKFSKTKKEL